MNLQIAIFDDEAHQRKQWCEKLNALDQGDVVPLVDFSKEVEKLEDRRKAARKKGGVKNLDELGIDSVFDGIDILIVDYDLLQETELTGEEIAYLLRCYSKCGAVVALNQFGINNFDLTLSGHPESFADLNVGSAFFDNPGLWAETGWDDFRPWSWPLLPDLHAAFERRIVDVQDQMKEPILSFLGLDTTQAGVLPRATLEFIQVPGCEPEKVTFGGFVTESGQGLKRRDAAGSIEEMQPRIAAARIHRWLECFVLAGQEALVDAPHLVERFPSLLDGSIDQQEVWNKTARISDTAGLKRDIIRSFEFARSDWLSRPAWYWPKTRLHEAIQEVADPWSVEPHPWAFCEDTSRFHLQRDTRQFVSEVPSNFARRYVRKIDGIEYHPSVRFSY